MSRGITIFQRLLGAVLLALLLASAPVEIDISHVTPKITSASAGHGSGGNT